MIYEHARISVEAASATDFERAFPSALAVISRAPGCRAVRLGRCLEQPGLYELVVEWESLEAHTEGFRNSEDFTTWRQIIGGFFAEPPEVLHFSTVA